MALPEAAMSEASKRRFLGVIEGGRESLEQQLFRAILLNLPKAEELARRLEPSANAAQLALVRGGVAEAAGVSAIRERERFASPTLNNIASAESAARRSRPEQMDVDADDH